MRKTLILTFILIIIVFYALAITFKLYLKTIFVDLFQHFIAGMIFGLIWLELNKNQPEKQTGMAVVGFVLLGSLVWEWVEFFFLTSLPVYSKQFYLSSSTVEDLITDLTAALAGGLVISTFRIFKK